MFFTPLYRHHGNNLQRKERTARIRNSHSHSLRRARACRTDNLGRR
ncbi:hypothetical protein FHX51_001087 [Aeriscardovia aeriphila]|uniref:Uncharacterized protein n=1 Tax=Aeriscardovia aeriphila TaxID=218139 RepID=A0A261F9P9_9BIFI|nr:hypothetical protein [Aeriscardovia aeriphila]OZG55713.1 hypothetical protein AEAE_0201 [Aeriscardovia aeriphila]